MFLSHATCLLKLLAYPVWGSSSQGLPEGPTPSPCDARFYSALHLYPGRQPLLHVVIPDFVTKWAKHSTGRGFELTILASSLTPQSL